MIDWDEDGDVRRHQEDSRSGGLRHVMAVPARIQFAGGGGLDAQIRNLSRDGMFLRHAMLVEKGDVDVLRVGTPLSVTFAPDHASTPDDKVQLSAEIVRRLPNGIGVRFVNMTREHRHALRVLAVLTVRARGSFGATSQERDEERAAKRDPRVIMGACRKVIERRLPNMIWTLRTEVAKQLRLTGQSATAGDPVDAREAAKAIEDKALAIGRTIERRVIQTFAEVGGLDDTQEVVLTLVQRAKIKAAAAGKEPALMDHEIIDGSVAMMATVQRFESALIGKSFEINVRMANVVGRRIDNLENPLVPQVICRMMWQSFTEHSESPRVHTCLHETLVGHIIPLLSEMYDELTKTLDQHKVPKAFGKGGGS